jgi:[ribosomal protein S5]-alanine N-acetyltransferase
MAKFQGQGIMKEAAQVVIEYAFQTLKFEKILAFTHYKNLNSTNLLLKLSFVKSIETDKENPNLKYFYFSTIKLIARKQNILRTKTRT